VPYQDKRRFASTKCLHDDHSYHREASGHRLRPAYCPIEIVPGSAIS
jgi:hypothetical protein